MRRGNLEQFSALARKEELTLVSKISQGGYGTVYRGVLAPNLKKKSPLCCYHMSQQKEEKNQQQHQQQRVIGGYGASRKWARISGLFNFAWFWADLILTHIDPHGFHSARAVRSQKWTVLEAPFKLDGPTWWQ